jgi:hypothetical protein
MTRHTTRCLTTVFLLGINTIPRMQHSHGGKACNVQHELAGFPPEWSALLFINAIFSPWAGMGLASNHHETDRFEQYISSIIRIFMYVVERSYG